MATPPKVLYWVDFRRNKSEQVPAPYGYYRHWSAPKGGKFTDRDSAVRRAAELRAQFPTAIVRLLTTGELEWKVEKEWPADS